MKLTRRNRFKHLTTVLAAKMLAASTYFRWWGFSIREGNVPCLHISWWKKGYYISPENAYWAKTEPGQRRGYWCFYFYLRTRYWRYVWLPSLKKCYREWVEI